jgi:glutamate racemase
MVAVVHWGLVDAGIGGLTVLAAMRQRRPDCDFLYCGDCRNMPYNIHPVAWIRGKAQQMLDRVGPRVERVAIACNSISTLVDQLGGRGAALLDIVAPTQRWLAGAVTAGSLVIIGNATTVASRVYERVDARVQIVRVPCPMLGATIERYGVGSAEVRACVAREIVPALPPRLAAPTTVLIACTHYPLVQDQIEEVVRSRVGEGARFVDAGLLFVDAVLGSDRGGPAAARPGRLEIMLNLDPDDGRYDLVRRLLPRLSLGDATMTAIDM